MSVETISKPLRSNAPGAEIIFRGLRYTSASDAKCRAEDCGTRSIHVHPLIAFTPKPRSGGARRRCGARGEGDLSFRGSSEKKKGKGKRTEPEKRGEGLSNRVHRGMETGRGSAAQREIHYITKESVEWEEKKETTRESGKGTAMIAFRFRRLCLRIYLFLCLSFVFASAKTVYTHRDFVTFLSSSTGEVSVLENNRPP